jgi:hypothetical protein
VNVRARIVCTALLLALAPGSASAEAPAGAAAAESPEFKRTIESALEEYRLGHFEEARTLFARAHAIEPSARTERGLGMVEFELRHYVAALQHLEAALASKVKALTDEQRLSVDDLRTRAKQFVAQYNLQIEPEDRGVILELDGRRVALDEARHVTLEAGEHTLRIGAPNTETRELHVDVKGGEQQTLRIQLELKQLPSATSEAPAASEVAEPKRDRLPLWLAVGGAGVAAVGGVLGGVALGAANGADTREGADADRARGLALGADVAIGAGAAAVIAGGIVWLVRRPSHADARVTASGSGLKVRF